MAIREAQPGHWVGTVKLEHAIIVAITTTGPSHSVVYSKLMELLGRII